MTIFLRKVRAFFFVLVLGITAHGSSPVLADGAVMFVTPPRVVMPPGEDVSILTITNKSDEPRRYDLTIDDQTMVPDGGVQRVDTFLYSAKRFVRSTPRRFTLQPGAQQAVRVMVERPEGLADGDYHTHLLFREVPITVKDRKQLEEEQKAAQGKKAIKFDIRTVYGIGVPVVIQQGKLKAELSLGDVRTGMTPDGRQRQISVDFIRTGNSETAGFVQVYYVSAGKAPVAVIPPQWVRAYREIDKISKDYPLALPPGAHGGKIIISLSKTDTGDDKTISKEVGLD